jgi:phosphoenolpyruvate phosphomutase
MRKAMSDDRFGHTKAQLLRRLLDSSELIHAVGAHNGLTAKLAERAGFDAVWASGFEISASYALPDASILTMTQFLDAAEAMDAATWLPVIADCDTGFGGPLNVAHAVRSYERRGIAGICIEDKVFPKVNSFAATTHDLVSAEEFCRKVRAGKSAQLAKEFVLVARTEALVSGLGMSAALSRSHAYSEAGADMILVHSKSRDPEQVLEFAARWDEATPLVAVPTTYDGVPEKELQEAGFSMVIYANHGIRAAIRSVSSVLAVLADSRRGQAVADQIVTMREVFDLQGMTMPFESGA